MRQLPHRSLRRLTALLAAAALTLTACGGGAGDKGDATPEASAKAGGSGGSFSFYAYSSGVNKLSAANGDNFQLDTLLYSALFTIDPASGEVQPLQAESATSDDQIHWTIKLKPDWTFSNGEPADAASYARAWNTMAYAPNALAGNYYLSMIEGYADLNPASGKPKVKEMSGVKVVDATTLEVTTTSPDPQLPYQLANPVLAPMSEANAADLKKADEAPIGNGPYQLSEFKHGQQVVVKRFEEYGGEPGLADEITVKIYADGTAAYNDFNAGNLDLIYPVPTQNLTAAQAEHAAGFSWSTLPMVSYLGFPVTKAPYDNADLRRALSLDIDRATIADKLLSGGGEAATALFSEGVVGSKPDSCTYCAFDAEQAKTLLEKAGGLTEEMPLYYSSDSSIPPVAEAMANQWQQDLGIKVKLTPMPGNQLYELQAGGKLEGPYLGGAGLFYPHIENALTIWFVPGGILNFMGYDNKEVTDLVTQGNSAPATEGLGYYEKAVGIVLDELPATPITYNRSGVISSDRLSGAAGGIQGLTDLAKVSVVE